MEYATWMDFNSNLHNGISMNLTFNLNTKECLRLMVLKQLSQILILN